MSGSGGDASGSAFGGASLTELRAMIADSNPGMLDTVAAKWAAVALALEQAQSDFLHHTRAATSHWTGTAADAFTSRATELHRALGNGADYASHASSGVSYAAEALRAARVDMPPDPASLESFVAEQQTQGTGTASDALHEQQRRRAVAVMEQLEEKYAEAGEMFGTPGTSRISFDRGVFSCDSPQKSQNTQKSDRGLPQVQQESEPALARQHGGSSDAVTGPKDGRPFAATSTSPTLDQHGEKSQAVAAESPSEFLAATNSERGLGFSAPASLDEYPKSAQNHTRSELSFSQTSHWTGGSTHEGQPGVMEGQIPGTGISTFGDLRDSVPRRFPVHGLSSSQHFRADTGARTSKPGSPVENFGPTVTGPSATAPDGRLTDDSLEPIPLQGNRTASPEYGCSIPVNSDLGRASRGSRNRRPSYLAEDPASWIPSSQINPPVIDR